MAYAMEDIVFLVCSFVGAIAGACLGAFLTGWLTEKGRRRAIRKDIEAILKEEQQRAYEQERGRRMATHEDIEKVLDQLRQTTIVSETIKHQIASGEWNRQWMLSQKLEIYRNCLEAIHSVRNAHIKTLSMLMWANAGNKPTEETKQRFGEVQRRRFDAIAYAKLLAQSAALLVSPAAAAVLQDAVEPRPVHGTTSTEVEINWLENEVDLLSKCCHQLLEAARRDIEDVRSGF